MKKPKKSIPRESTITKSIQADLKQRPDVFVHKQHAGRFGNVGLPDLLVIFTPIRPDSGSFWDNLGIVVGIEVKRPGKLPTELQRKMMVKLGKCGAFTFVAHSKAEAINFLETLSIPKKVAQPKPEKKS